MPARRLADLGMTEAWVRLSLDGLEPTIAAQEPRQLQILGLLV